MDDSQAWLRRRLRTMQIIALAIVGGAVTAMVVMIGIRAAGEQGPAAEPMLSYLALGFGALQVATSFVLPRLVEEASLKKMISSSEPIAPERLVDIFQTVLIVSLALLESAVFFGAIAFLIEGQIWALTPCLIGIGLMGLKLPTELRLVNWLDLVGQSIQERRG